MPELINLIGVRFERLIVIGRYPQNGPKGEPRWQCMCDCGVVTIALGQALREKRIKSCGCLVKSRAIQNDFWSACDKSGGPNACWPWRRAIMKSGYGSVFIDGKPRSAHRIAYEIAFGSIPKGPGYHGFVVRHACDNRACVNPAHLELGTQFQNCLDREARGRTGYRPRGSEHKASRFTEAQVLAIKAELARGLSYTRTAAMFDCSRGAIAAIGQGRTWGWLDTPLGQAAIERATQERATA